MVGRFSKTECQFNGIPGGPRFVREIPRITVERHPVHIIEVPKRAWEAAWHTSMTSVEPERQGEREGTE